MDLLNEKRNKIEDETSSEIASQALSVEPLASEQGQGDSSDPELVLPDPDKDLELAPLSGEPDFSGVGASEISASPFALSGSATPTSPNLYSYNVIARTGSAIPGGTPTSFEDGISINDDGVVGFVGRFGSVEDLLIGDTEPIGSTGEIIRNLTPTFSGTFSRAVQINNNNEVIGQNPGIDPAVRVWAGNVTAGANFATIATASDSSNFENTFAFPSINKTGEVVFEADPRDGSSNPFVLVTSGFQAPATIPLEFNQASLLTQSIRPLIADTGEVLVRDPSSQIILYDFDLSTQQGIAIAGTGSSASFNSVGLAPGISDNAKAITFFADLQPEDAIAFGTTSGPGIFASVETSSGRNISRLAGIAGNGFLDPGETFTDTNSNGVFDQGTDVDQGIIASFAPNERVGVSYSELADQGIGTAAYLAFNASGQETLLTSRFSVSLPTVSLPTAELSASAPVVVARVGDDATKVSPDLTGTVADLSIYDPINNDEQVAFWTRTSTSQEAIVRANPILRPVLVLPGIGGSLPASGVLGGMFNQGYGQWLRNRGVEPDTLRLDENGRTYDDLIETLKRSGYVEGVNLFGAAYDWRLNPGPIDGVIDGRLDYSASQITDNTYEYAVDHLGFWIKRAIEGWRTQFPAGAAPALESIDVIAHSTGGLVTRAYIQSTGYQNEVLFSFTDSNGEFITAPLPRVNNFTMIGVPNRGSSLTWNQLNNNFAGGFGARTLRGFIAAARNKVLSGEQILLSGGTNGAITAAADPLTFIKEYVPTLRALLATYPFIDDLADPTNTLRTAQEINPALSNNFLLDLNNGFDSTTTAPGDPTRFVGPLPSGKLGVEQLNVIYGNSENTRATVEERTGFPPRQVFRIDSAIPFLEFGPSFRDSSGQLGDGTVPVQSAIELFTSSPKPNINLRGYGLVDHTELVSNVDVQKFILQTLGATLDESNISTNLRGSSLSPFIGALVGSGLGILLSLDPVEGFVVDNLGRRLGYSQASGPVTEIPGSFWLGEEDGIGWSTDLPQGPFELQLTGLGESYSVSLSIETPDGVGAIETSGFLATGEQLTVAVPFNNFPILDLNGSGNDVNFSTTFTAPGSALAVTGPDLTVADVDNPNLEEAIIALINPLDGSSEFLSATPVGNIAVTYDPVTSTLTLSGNDSIANYQQVLRTVTYTNTASRPTPTERQIAFVVNDGQDFGNFSQVATTAVTFSPAGGIIGTPGNDTLTGTPNNDTINGFEGNDLIFGAAGDDSILGGLGNDSVDGGIGNDSITGGAGLDTIDGGEGNDTIGGGDNNDTINGGAGDDNIYGGATDTGNDSITGGAGFDFIDGGEGNDTIGGGDNNDTINGGAGDDNIFGGATDTGNDSITGGAGFDFIDGGEGNDFLDGGDGNDYMLGEAGNDSISGGAGLDTIDGGEGNDTIGGGDNNDTINGGAGDDNIYGGATDTGNDSITGGAGFDFIDGGEGNDTIGGGDNNDTINGGAGDDNIFGGATDTGNDSITGGAGFDFIDGGEGNDFLDGGDGNDYMLGEAGNDSISGGAGFDFIDGGEGNDTIGGGDNNDTINGGAGDDNIFGGATDTGNDSISGGAGFDFIDGGEGNDTIGGGDNNDTINGGAGDDNIFGGATDTGNDSITGGAGFDFIDGGEGNDTIGGGDDNDTINGGAGDDNIYGGATGNDSITGGAGFDFIDGGEGNDTIGGGDDNDTINGGAGDDNIYGGDSGDDILIGAAGNDVLNGGVGNDVLNGGTGDDSLLGGLGDDTYFVDSPGDSIDEAPNAGTDEVRSFINFALTSDVENLRLDGASAINGTGNTLNNSITGNNAANTLNGGAGADSLTGGLGNDAYVVDNSGDVVTETSTVATEIDTVASSVNYSLGTNVENLRLDGASAINGTGNTLNNVITGSDANNILDGGLGIDTLNGLAGNDILVGGAGNDLLTGGVGTDQFLYNTNAAFVTSGLGVDRINDFSQGVDKIVLDKTTFTALSSLAGTGFSVAGEFATVTSDAAAATSSADIVYSSATNNLFYNQNGTAVGFGSGAQFATLTGISSLVGTDFLIQA